MEGWTYRKCVEETSGSATVEGSSNGQTDMPYSRCHVYRKEQQSRFTLQIIRMRHLQPADAANKPELHGCLFHLEDMESPQNTQTHHSHIWEKGNKHTDKERDGTTRKQGGEGRDEESHRRRKTVAVKGCSWSATMHETSEPSMCTWQQKSRFIKPGTL